MKVKKLELIRISSLTFWMEKTNLFHSYIIQVIFFHPYFHSIISQFIFSFSILNRFLKNLIKNRFPWKNLIMMNFSMEKFQFFVVVKFTNNTQWSSKIMVIVRKDRDVFSYPGNIFFIFINHMCCCPSFW